MVDSKTKEMKLEEANALALYRDWEENEVKVEMKNKASK